jgi:hypothetical protein
MNGSTITSTSTQNMEVVSHPVHPAFARRGTSINLQGQTTKATSVGSQNSSSSTASLDYSITSKGWQNTDANKVLQIYPTFWFQTMYIGTPTEVPAKPMQLDSTKVVSGWQDYAYFYQTSWGTQWSSFFTQTSIYKPGAWGDPSFSHD